MTDEISEDEKQLFRDSVSQARPLKKNNKIHYKKPAPKAKPVQQPDFADDGIEVMLDTPNVGSQEYLYFHQGGLQNKVLRDLRQNKFPIEAELDLHGFTIAQAEKKIKRFIIQAQQEHKKVVRIIHGKGMSQENNLPPIKNTVNRMLRQNSNVIAFCSAHQRHGGTGAVNVMLKKKLTDEF
jgi:DNA-nicking Smr family endonuclease